MKSLGKVLAIGAWLIFMHQPVHAQANLISFTIGVPNNYVSSLNVPVQLAVTGSPYYVAVSVDDPNYAAAAIWNPSTGSTVTVPLGLTEGWHDVWIGLRGHADAPNAAVWQWKRLKLDTTPPALVITGPTNGTVDVPLIQLTGYSPEPLSSISYDLTNATGLVSNQPVLLLDKVYSQDTSEFTTNTFQGFDLPLTNGLNVITLHAIDLAGNETVLTTNITLSFSNKPAPTVQLTWPQNGTQISGSNFTCRGWLSDPTATIATQLIITNGDTNVNAGGVGTNVYTGSVGRNGVFWLENLPLNPGTNIFPITVTDLAGNLTTTNLSVVQSPLLFAINAVADPATLWQPTVDLTGTISDPAYAVWVNGIKGTNNADGSWSANNVPVNKGGTASFVGTAYAPNELQPDGSTGN